MNCARDVLSDGNWANNDRDSDDPESIHRSDLSGLSEYLATMNFDDSNHPSDDLSHLMRSPDGQAWDTASLGDAVDDGISTAEHVVDASNILDVSEEADESIPDNPFDYLPVINIEDSMIQEKWFKGYIVQREPKITDDSMNECSKVFVEHVVQNCKKKFKDSAWCLVWKSEDDVWACLAEQDCPGEYASLTSMIDSGLLHGCELRCDGSRIGLFATEDLPANTCVGIECGVLYSEPEYDNFLKNREEIMVRLTSTVIDPKLLEPLADAEKWSVFATNLYQERVPKFVMAADQHGNETPFIRRAEGDQKANLAAFALIDLKNAVVSVAYETKHIVGKGEELLQDY